MVSAGIGKERFCTQCIICFPLPEAFMVSLRGTSCSRRCSKLARHPFYTREDETSVNTGGLILALIYTPMPQEVISQHNCQHGFTNRHRANANTRIVTSLGHYSRFLPAPSDAASGREN